MVLPRAAPRSGGPKSSGGGPSDAFHSEPPLCLVSAVAAILGPRVGGQAGGLGEGGGPGDRGRSGLQAPSAAAAATAFVSGSDSESPQPGGGSARRGGGRSPGDGPARARAKQPAPTEVGGGEGVRARGVAPPSLAPRTCALSKSCNSALLGPRIFIGALLRWSRPLSL